MPDVDEISLDITLDCDGVIYPFVEVVSDYFVDELGYSPEQCPKEIFDWHFYEHDWDMDDQEFYRGVRQGIESGVIFRTGVPYPGIADVISALQAVGHRVHVVTARNLDIMGRTSTMRRYTFEWFCNNGIYPDSIVIFDKKELVRSDIIFDDSVHTCLRMEALDNAPYPVLYTQSWNYAEDWSGARVHNPREAYDLVRETAKAYKKNFGSAAEYQRVKYGSS